LDSLLQALIEQESIIAPYEVEGETPSSKKPDIEKNIKIVDLWHYYYIEDLTNWLAAKSLNTHGNKKELIERVRRALDDKLEEKDKKKDRKKRKTTEKEATTTTTSGKDSTKNKSKKKKKKIQVNLKSPHQKRKVKEERQIHPQNQKDQNLPDPKKQKKSRHDFQ